MLNSENSLFFVVYLCIMKIWDIVEEEVWIMKEIVVSKALFSRYKTITDAVKGASPGNTIVVKPGVYRENIHIDKDINIISEGNRSNTVIETFQTAISINDRSKAFIKGFQIRHLGQENAALIDCVFGKVQLQECDIYPQNSSGVYVRGQGILHMQSCQVTGGYSNAINFGDGSQGVIEDCEIHGMKGEDYPAIFINNSNPIIKNCRIYNSTSEAIYIKNGSKASIENCDMFNIDHNIICILNSAPVIKKCKIHDGSESGIYMYQGSAPEIEECEIFKTKKGAVFICESQPVLKECKIYNGQANGITFKKNSVGKIEECEIFNLNGGEYPSIWIEESSPILVGCKIHDVEGIGCFVTANSEPIIERCEFFELEECAFKIATSNPIIKNCTIYNGKINGFYIKDSSRPIIEGCEIYNFNEQIIYVFASSPTLRNCSIHHGKTNGIVFYEKSEGIVEDCNIHQFESEEYPVIYIEASSPTFTSCKIHDGKNRALRIVQNSNPIIESCEVFRFSKDMVESIESHVIVRNCNIYEGQLNGIRLLQKSSGLIEGCHLSHFVSKEHTIIWVEDSNVEVKTSKITEGENLGVYIENGGTCIAENSEIYKLGGSAVSAYRKGEGVFRNCKIYDAEQSAFYIENSHISIEGCIVEECKGNGLNCKENTISKSVDSEFSGFSYPIIWVENSDIHLIRNKIRKGKQEAVVVKKDSILKVEDCEIFQFPTHPAIAIEQNVKGTIQQCNIYDTLVGIDVDKTSHMDIKDIKCFDIEKTAYQIADSSPSTLENCKTYVEVKNQQVQSNAGPEVKEENIEQEQEQKEDMASEDIMLELNRFVGMNSIKDQIKQLINLVEITRYRKEAGLDSGEEIKPKHTVFYGNPGTGKTTIARLLGKVYKSLGLLEKGHVVEVKREDLVGAYIGHSEEQTKKYIAQAMGGVLFIDEAYSLSVEDGIRDFGKQVIDVLLAALENHRGEFLCIVAGYEKEMDRFIASNPGLKSRFVSYMKFDDYTPNELMEIGNRLLDDKKYRLTGEAKNYVYEKFMWLYRKRDEHFGNARMVREQVDQWITFQANRISALPRSEWKNKGVLTTIMLEDVEKAFQQKGAKKVAVPINEKLLQEQMDRLNSLIGLKQVKKEIEKLIQLVSYYREEGKNISELSMHITLIGNPGTGKTEVARIIAKVYEALGILERGDCIEVDRKDLVDKYIGGTEEKTNAVLQKAIGGTLFIDEAYTLTNKDGNNPGHIAVELLLKQMEDKRGEFIVLVAGYEDEMEEFLDSNKGLRRRFDRRLVFEDYTPEEMIQIADYYTTKKQYCMSAEARDMLVEYFTYLYEKRDKTYGNAGLARKIIEQAMKNLDYRIATLPVENRTDEQKYTIDVEDIQALLQQQE